ncbi:MAG: DUF721 domain-containing protein [Myxococcota bacterium]|nr:DUF721 domain-containing protein [Myxococcota bacterium]
MRRGRRSEPTAMGSLLGKVLEDLGMEAASRAHEVNQRWEEAVGPEVAAHCQPVGVRNGVLEARVDSSVWAQQLQLRTPEILEALRGVLGKEAPTALRFRVGYSPSRAGDGGSGASPGTPGRGRPGRGKRD